MAVRRISRVDIADRFARNFSRLPERVKKLARKKHYLFQENAFHPLLRTHKLSGELKEDWAYSVNQQYRVHFYFVDDHIVVYLDIGTHEIYK